MVFDKSIKFVLANGEEVTFDDAVKAGAGTTAYNQFIAKDLIHSFMDVSGEELEVYIPFHAIISATLTVDGKEVTLTDAVCGGSACCDPPPKYYNRGEGETMDMECGQTYDGDTEEGFQVMSDREFSVTLSDTTHFDYSYGWDDPYYLCEIYLTNSDGLSFPYILDVTLTFADCTFKFNIRYTEG